MQAHDSDRHRLPSGHFIHGRLLRSGNELRSRCSSPPPAVANLRIKSVLIDWPEVHGRLATVRAAAYAEAGGKKDSFMCRRRPQAPTCADLTCFNEILLTRHLTQVNPP
jgi:hypothetical protein